MTKKPPKVDKDDQPKQTTQLSTAFVVVLVLHFVAIGAIYIYNSIKAERKARYRLLEETEIPNHVHLRGLDIEISPALKEIILNARTKVLAHSDLYQLNKAQLRQIEYDALGEAFRENDKPGAAYVKVASGEDHRTLILHASHFPQGQITPQIGSLLDRMEGILPSLDEVRHEKHKLEKGFADDVRSSFVDGLDKTGTGRGGR